MVNSVDHIADQLFKVIRGFGHPLILYTEGGKQTSNPEEARRFYATDIKMMVNFVVDQSTTEIVVNLSDGTDIKAVKPMLSSIRNLANTHIIEYTVKTFGKAIEPRDFSFMAKKTVGESDISSDEYRLVHPKTKKEVAPVQRFTTHGKARAHIRDKYMVMKNNGQWVPKSTSTIVPIVDKVTPVNEGFSGWSGSARKSVNELGSAKIIVRHKRTVDEEQRGARTRQIESIFIENGDGERFKFPSRNITAAKAMARHVKEGGTPFDTFGQHIYGIMEELNQLKTFQRKNKRNDFFEDAEIGEEIGSRIVGLRKNLTQIAGPKGYATQFESFSSADEVPQERLDELKDAVTVSYFDEGIQDALPYVARIIEGLTERREKQTQAVDFARFIMHNEDSISLNSRIDDDDPESPSAQQFGTRKAQAAAWASYLTSKVTDEKLAKMLSDIADSVNRVDEKHVGMINAAINVIKRNGQVAEDCSPGHTDDNDNEAEALHSITESLDSFDIRKLFGV